MLLRRSVRFGACSVLVLLGGGLTACGSDASTVAKTASPPATATTTTTTTSTATTTVPAADRLPVRWVAGPDAPLPLGGLTVSAGTLVIAGPGSCCSMLPGPELAAYDATSRSWALLPPYPGGCGAGAAVWTGRELVAAGGRTSPTCDDPGSVATSDAFALDPVAGSWRPLAPAPLAVGDLDGVWTGREAIFVGGPVGGEGPPAATVLLRYVPDDDTWETGQAPPGPPRSGASVVWAGDRLIVWGGFVDAPDAATGLLSMRDGFSYDPVADEWSPIPPAPIPGAGGAVAAWTGNELLVFGGSGTEGAGSQVVDRTSGAAYDPDRAEWRTLAAAPPDLGSAIDEYGWDAVGAWTGEELVVLVGRASIEASDDQELVGAAYDPAGDAWRVLPVDSGMTTAAAAVWTGQSVAVVGGYRVGEDRYEGIPPHLVELVAERAS